MHKRTFESLYTFITVPILTDREKSFEGFLADCRARVSMPTAVRTLRKLYKEAAFGEIKAFYEEFTRRLDPYIEHEALHTDVSGYDESLRLCVETDLTALGE